MLIQLTMPFCFQAYTFFSHQTYVKNRCHQAGGGWPPYQPLWDAARDEERRTLFARSLFPIFSYRCVPFLDPKENSLHQKGSSSVLSSTSLPSSSSSTPSLLVSSFPSSSSSSIFVLLFLVNCHAIDYRSADVRGSPSCPLLHLISMAPFQMLDHTLDVVP